MRNFRELLVWQKAHAFTLEVYRISRSFPLTPTTNSTQGSAKSAGCSPRSTKS